MLKKSDLYSEDDDDEETSSGKKGEKANGFRSILDSSEDSRS
jgi:hypothetical protein